MRTLIIKTPLPMLTKEQIIPYLDTYVRSFEFNRASEYVNVSSCHRVIAHVLLRRHYRKVAPQCIRHTFESLSFSPETIRRAVKDGFDMGVIERLEGGDDEKRGYDDATTRRRVETTREEKRQRKRSGLLMSLPSPGGGLGGA